MLSPFVFVRMFKSANCKSPSCVLVTFVRRRGIEPVGLLSCLNCHFIFVSSASFKRCSYVKCTDAATVKTRLSLSSIIQPRELLQVARLVPSTTCVKWTLVHRTTVDDGDTSRAPVDSTFSGRHRLGCSQERYIEGSEIASSVRGPATDFETALPDFVVNTRFRSRRR
jgi:hypothetical protein